RIEALVNDDDIHALPGRAALVAQVIDAEQPLYSGPVRKDRVTSLSAPVIRAGKRDVAAAAGEDLRLFGNSLDDSVHGLLGCGFVLALRHLECNHNFIQLGCFLEPFGTRKDHAGGARHGAEGRPADCCTENVLRHVVRQPLIGTVAEISVEYVAVCFQDNEMPKRVLRHVCNSPAIRPYCRRHDGDAVRPDLAMRKIIIDKGHVRQTIRVGRRATMAACPSNGTDTSPLDRPLAGIAFVDIVGYSILMARDETRTHQRWMTILDNVIRPQISRHPGKIVKSTGDGVLAEFPSAFDAVEWAQGVQRAMQPQSSGETLPIALRIAVHVGDIITTEFDVFGDGVNLTARLQEHAPPGGIVLSEAVHDLVRGSVGTQARDLGPLTLKNFEKPVRAYALDIAAGPVPGPAPRAESRLPSIAVLPLRNTGGDPADDYFCDGCVEDITLSLAGLRELMVISRSSTLAYQGRQADPREVGRVFGVRYVLTGSIRRSERLVRVSVELCDASTGAALWGDKVEGAPGELFDVQDRIVEKIVAGIAPNVRAAELRAAMRKKPENFTAYDCTLRALHIMNSLEKETFTQARDYLEQAMAEDAEFAMPVAWAARWHNIYVGQGWSANPSADRAKAAELAARAIELDGQNAIALATFGHLKSFLFHDYDSALVYFDRALAACPSHSFSWFLSSPPLSYVGRGEQAIKHAQHALRLSPLDRSLFAYYSALNLAYYAHGDYEESVRWGKLSASENPLYTANLRYLVAGLAALDRTEEAREAAAKLVELEPDFHLGTFEKTLQPFRDSEISSKFIEHLKKSGLPV